MAKKLKKDLLDYYNDTYWDEPKETETEKIQAVQEFLKEEWGEGGDKGYAIFTEANDIEFEYGDTGVYVSEEDFDEAESILMEMEEE